MIEAARDSRTEASQMAVISKAMLDEIDPDLFWNAAGQHWADYKSQWEFFQLLHGYVTNYAAEGADEAVLKRIWTIYIERLDDELQTGNGVGMGTVDRVYLSDDDLMAVNIDPDGYEYLWGNLYENTAYMVECTGAESDPYHSVVGLINTISGYYGGESVANEVWGYDYYSYFGYWPIQMYNAEGYAAQPFCYVAALDDGDEEAAFKVVQEIMKQPFSLQFGFSVYEPAWRDKLDAWINTANYLFERSGRYVRYAVGQKKWLEDAGSSLLSANHMDEARRIQIGEVLTNQLDNVQFAQIADAEVLAIWQETLSECASSGLSAEAGFELLCERMEAWHEEIDLEKGAKLAYTC